MRDARGNEWVDALIQASQPTPEQENWKPAQGDDPYATCVDRRSFLKGGALLFGGLAFAAPLQSFMARKAYACGEAGVSPYGPPVATADNSTGLKLIKLPEGFEYWSFGWSGDPMSDGHITPRMHDGMAVARTTGNSKTRVVLIRNHEVDQNSSPFANGIMRYGQGGGGNVNLIWDTRKQQLVKDEASLSGTVRNCAGGVTPWGSWLSCEETNFIEPDGTKHGYCFDVQTTANWPTNAVPITSMGRFSHEALVVDPRDGYIYETEDGPSFGGDAGSGFYRFIPNVYGVPHAGGTLQMMAIKDQPQKNLQFTLCGSQFDVTWVDVPNPDPDVEGGELSCFRQGYQSAGAQKGANFRRLEGCWYGNGKIYFLSTDGGPLVAPNNSGEGQVFEYDPEAETLRVIFHSPESSACENPDNMVVTPRGGLLLCEDNAGSGPLFPDGERLLGLTLDGQIFTFAVNNLNFTAGGLGSYARSVDVPGNPSVWSADGRHQEWAGACYSPDGQWLFANCQGAANGSVPALTYAIRPKNGNWGPGPL